MRIASSANRFRLLSLAALLLVVPPARADETLDVVCGMQVAWCMAMKDAFEKKTGAKVNLARMGSSEALAQIAAEKANPKLDIWIGGTGDPHLQAAEQDLTVSYLSSALPQLHDWARRQAERSNYRTVGIYAGALGFGYNVRLLEKKKLPVPACWKDLLKPEYRDEIWMADPNFSGTAYVAIATLVQLMGEAEAFSYLKALHRNVNRYTKSGVEPIKAVARGETAVSISFIHDGVSEAVDGYPVKVIAPCEGTGYEIGSMSIIKGARNPDLARKWYEWALTPQAQKLGAATRQFQVPSNSGSTLPPQTPKFQDIRLIDYDFAKYGSAGERDRLIARWNREIGGRAR